MTDKYNWTDNPTVSGESICDTDVLNDCLMHLKYDHSSGSGLNMFDIVAKDHVLSYQETQGFAQLGAWVYKDPSLGISYGYPDFYAKCLEEKNAGETVEITLCSHSITVKRHSNGHEYFDIADKDVIDEFYVTYGAAWFYCVDETNERVFLPRNDYFFQSGAAADVGKFVEAGLPNITGHIEGRGLVDREGMLNASGCLLPAQSVNRQCTQSNSDGTTTQAFNIDASKSSAIYGKSNTVQPNAVKLVYYMVVGNTANVTSTTVELTSSSAVAPLSFNTGTGAIKLNYTDGLSLDSDGNLTGLTMAQAATAAMPSSQYIDLTLGASGATYTAPADGYVQLSANAATHIDLVNMTTGIRTGGTYTNSTYRYAYIPVRQNDVFVAWYTISSLDNFRFIYAEGAKND